VGDVLQAVDHRRRDRSRAPLDGSRAQAVPPMVQRAPDRAGTGGVAYARLRGAWRTAQTAPRE
jgi:hypothetical protein